MAGEKGAGYAIDLLAVLFQKAALAGMWDAAASPQLSLAVALHTADPTSGGNQSTNEVAYTGYARATVLRTAAGWTITGATVTPTNPINFPTCTSNAGGTPTATWFSVGQLSSGAGYIMYTGPVSPSIAISIGITPQLTTATVITEA